MGNPKKWATVYLPDDLADRLNKYILSAINERGLMLHGIKSEIMKQALKEWLDKHEKEPLKLPAQ
jgi:post-segregation antitoxin (ccd killing protein)